MEINPTQRRTWAEIDLDAIRSNFREIRKRVGASKVCCTIKANGYGHGAVTLAKVYETEGADFFAVSNIEEALQLRRAGVALPILLLGYTDPKCAGILAEHDLSQCVYSLEFARALSMQASTLGVSIKVHIKVDTGMGRIGFLPSELDDLIEACTLKGFIREGIFTHFASADEGNGGEEYTIGQYKKLVGMINALADRGIEFKLHHCANSAGISDYPDVRLDMVRAGIVLYGVQPSGQVRDKLNLRPALSLKTVISHIKVLKKGEFVSYGRTFTAPKDMVVATMPIGYADGLLRANFTKGFAVEVCGHKAPIIGRICMDQTIVDVTGIPDVKVGEIVTVYGEEGYNSVDEVARLNGTINYEVLCAVGARVPRIYVEGGKIVSLEESICAR